MKWRCVVPVMTLRLAIAAWIVLLLGACGLTGQISPISIIAPEITTQPDSRLEPVDWSLQVRRPVADRMRDSERILVRTGASRLQPWPGAAWLDNVPDMIQALTVQALEDSGRLAGVGRAGGLRSRFALATEVRRFEAVDDGNADLAVNLVIQSNLVDQRTGAVAASRTFTIREPSSDHDLDALVLAFERALQEYFSRLTDWVVTEGEQALAMIEERRENRRVRRTRPDTDG